MKQRFLLLCVLSIWLVLPISVSGEMSSVSYQIYADNIDTGGGSLSSASYNLEDSAGESPVGVSVGGIYEIRAGYQYMERGGLSMNITPDSVNLGELSAGAINQGAVVATVSTDSENGYSLSISSVSGSAIQAVSDGLVTAGVEEYGISGSGGANQIVGDVAVANGLAVAFSASAIDESATTLTFKASISDSSVSGSYGQNIILTALSNF